MKKTIFIFISLLFVLSVKSEKETKLFRIVSYNVENYFDVVDDPEKADEEYLFGGIRGWNESKYIAKQANIAKVLTAIGGWQSPAIVGLCEIESEKALIDLTKYSPLKNLDYRFIHYESPDVRGVDVALLYQRDQFRPLHSEAIPIMFSSDSYKTRDILYVKGIIESTTDTLHLFVCHWPSRLGGELESEERRIEVAQTLRGKTDSIFLSVNAPNIVVMGDFNDYPSNASIVKTVGANPPNEEFQPENLYNLAAKLEDKGKGSHKFQGEWGMLDQIIVSGGLLDNTKGVFTTSESMQVFDADFLLEDDRVFLGKQPKRTYVGMKYQGGFSDHLPVFIDLWYY